MDEVALEPNVNPSLWKINARNRAFWDRRNAIEAKLLSDAETAHYVIENLRAQEFQDALLREVQGGAATASSALKTTSTDLAKASSELQRIHDGASKREDQLDKQQFIHWITTHDIRVERITDLWERPGFRWGKYGRTTLKSWYKDAMPEVELRPGRPRSK